MDKRSTNKQKVELYLIYKSSRTKLLVETYSRVKKYVVENRFTTSKEKNNINEKSDSFESL